MVWLLPSASRSGNATNPNSPDSKTKRSWKRMESRTGTRLSCRAIAGVSKHQSVNPMDMIGTLPIIADRYETACPLFAGYHRSIRHNPDHPHLRRSQNDLHPAIVDGRVKDNTTEPSMIGIGGPCRCSLRSSLDHPQDTMILLYPNPNSIGDDTHIHEVSPSNHLHVPVCVIALVPSPMGDDLAPLMLDVVPLVFGHRIVPNHTKPNRLHFMVNRVVGPTPYTVAHGGTYELPISTPAMSPQYHDR